MDSPTNRFESTNLYDGRWAFGGTIPFMAKCLQVHFVTSGCPVPVKNSGLKEVTRQTVSSSPSPFDQLIIANMSVSTGVLCLAAGHVTFASIV